jgi:hypothetical protein
MSATRPLGPPTGLVTPGCYAAPLRDCDGAPLTREHYISEALLLRFPKGFNVEGLPWLPAAKPIGPKGLASNILCERHNNALSPLDDLICSLYDVVKATTEGRHGGSVALDGEDLERWAIKLLFGLGAAGAVVGPDGKADRIPVPEQWLRVLFGEASLPDGCGFFYVGDPVDGFDADLLTVGINRYPVGTEEPGAIFGITIKLVAFQYTTTLSCRLEVDKQRLDHRPGGFQLGQPELGRIGLRWNPPSSKGLVLKFP